MQARGSFDDYLRSPSQFTSQGNQRLKLEWRREWVLYLHLLPPFFVHMEERNTFRAIAVNTHSLTVHGPIRSLRIVWFWLSVSSGFERICASTGIQVVFASIVQRKSVPSKRVKYSSIGEILLKPWLRLRPIISLFNFFFFFIYYATINSDFIILCFQSCNNSFYSIRIAQSITLRIIYLFIFFFFLSFFTRMFSKIEGVACNCEYQITGR